MGINYGRKVKVEPLKKVTRKANIPQELDEETLRNLVREDLRNQTLGTSSNLWDEKQLAKYLNKSVRSIQGMRYLGGGPKFVRLGTSIRYRPSDVERWLDENTANTTSDVSSKTPRGQTRKTPLP